MTEFVNAMVAQAQIVHDQELRGIAGNISTNMSPGAKKVFALQQKQTITTPHRSYVMPRYEGNQIDFSQGALVETNNPFHVALSGRGFFTVQNQDGNTMLTRKGNFQVNPATGSLITAEGYTVMGQGGPIVLDPSAGPYRINGDGSIVNQAGLVDTLAINTVEQGAETRLRDAGGYFLLPAAMNTIPAENFELHQGKLEQSNIIKTLEAAQMAHVTRKSGMTRRLATDMYEQQKKLIGELGKVNV